MIIRSSPTGDNYFFAAVKSFDANVAISANFVLTEKKIECDKLAWLNFYLNLS